MAPPFRHNGDMAHRRAMEQRLQQNHVDIQRLQKLVQALMGQGRGTTGDIIDETPTGGPGGETYTAGFGLDLTSFEFSVDTSDLAGDGLAVGTGDVLEVNTACGLEISTGAVQVKRDDLLGDGLEAGATGCLIDVKPYCGITVDSNGVGVNRTDLIGPGLKAGATGCLIAVDFSCGLELSGTAIRVKNSDLQGAGLAATGTCALQVATGCGLAFGTPSGGITPLEVDCRDFIDGVSITAALVGGCYVASVDDEYVEGKVEEYLNSEAGQALLDSKIADYIASNAGCAAVIGCVAQNCDLECDIPGGTVDACTDATEFPTVCVSLSKPGMTTITETLTGSGSTWTSTNFSASCSGDKWVVVVESGIPSEDLFNHEFDGFGSAVSGAYTLEFSEGSC